MYFMYKSFDFGLWWKYYYQVLDLFMVEVINFMSLDCISNLSYSRKYLYTFFQTVLKKFRLIQQIVTLIYKAIAMASSHLHQNFYQYAIETMKIVKSLYSVVYWWLNLWIHHVVVQLVLLIMKLIAC